MWFETGDEQRGGQEQPAERGHREPRSAEPEQDARCDRAHERHRGGDRPGDDVRCDELIGRVREHREQRRLHRTRQRHASRRDRGQRVHDGDRRVRVDRSGGSREGHGLGHVSGEQYSIPADLVADHRCHRGDDRRRHLHDHRDEAGLRNAPALVREDEDGNPHPPPRDVEEEVRELDPPELEVSEDGLDGPDRPGPTPPPHRRRMAQASGPEWLGPRSDRGLRTEART